MRPELASGCGEALGTSYSVYAPRSEEARATVVLIHGVGMNQSVWSPQIGALSTRYQVIVYDMLGHGDSVLPSAAPTLDEYAAQLKLLLDAMRIERAHVVGHSMGALVALEFALTHPQRTLSVVALNAVYDRTPAQREAVMTRAATLGDAPLDTGVDATLSRWFGDPVPGHLTQAAQAVRGLLLSVDPVGYARTYRLFASSDDAHVGRLASLAVPALFLTGECDPNSSPAMSRAMAAVAPFGRAEIIANERHMMNVTDPEGVNERLLGFLAEASAQEAAHESINGERHD
ncbi:hydrolase [Paraburkholderia caffeinilytica]|uniref:Alpha/beta hydrolase n=1 Tax=Paraburkholderia caffeinilytica TaxID=1761016 RepID=A0ABQ1NDA8_9BURK|nr:alpha/beta hydrolase [Paraburkholderia caffeinilytica]AXL53872.1 hydrolase [Paraburkholderia caffeinilytica]GGC64430.1 alpha/beta hydrolase [Paraburkholderia caffeinilytica]CAB3800295.1 (E)-2-((N-methylformamido)methylene)succinate hydrolase [Paraburkholderia caffeinilytica]